MAAVEVYTGYSDHPDDEDEDFLSEEELAELQDWVPPCEEYEDLVANPWGQQIDVGNVISISPSQFTEFAFRMPTTLGWENFSFEGRRGLRHIYDTSAKRILLMCGRQVEKSTLLGNMAVSRCCLINAYKILYVSPSQTQTKTFSNDRLKDPIETSPVLKSFTAQMLSQNVFEKQFVNRSKITLRYAFLNADRTRGVPAHGLLLDEIQDILSDNIPVIEQCTFHSPEDQKSFIYSGTPKTLDNVIEDYWAKRSTQNQWVVPCDCKGGEGCRFWNILTEKNIGKKHLICEHCGKQIYPMMPDAQWASAVAFDPVYTPFEGYRIPQLMVPWLDWSELLYNYEHYSRAKFYNEVLGISFDTGLRPLTTAQIMMNCNPNVFMSDLEKYQRLSASHDIFAGIDWGTGENTYTVLSLGLYVQNKFRIFYMHRFTGEDTEPERQHAKIEQILRTFNVRLIGVDHGGGYHPNDFLTRKFGFERVLKYQYAARVNGKLRWDPKLRRFLTHRTEAMSAVFNAIKRGTVFEFPRWIEFKEPYAQDMLNIYSYYNEKLRMLMYDHTIGKTDDAFHSLVYCFLASMIVRPRPDIIAPSKETAGVGPVWSSYSGPIDQG